MAAQNKVTLTFAGDTTSLDRAMRQVQSSGQTAESAVTKSSKEMGDALEGTAKQARGTTEIFRAMGDASVFMGSEMGAGTQQIILMGQAAHGLTKGLGQLVSTLGLAKVATGGLIAAIATGGAVIAAHIDHTSTMNEVNRTAADSAYYLADGLAFVTQGVPVLGGWLDKLKGKTDSWSQSAHDATQQAYDLTAALLANDNAQRRAGTYGIADQNPGGDAFADMSVLDTLDLDPTPVKVKTAAVAHAYSSGGSAIAKAIDTAAAAAKAKLQRWQDVADKFSGIAKDISDSLGPKLVQGDQSSLRLFPGATMLDKLKKQLADTLHLKTDLAKLSKAGLSSDLLEQLTAGGLDSIGTADELLASGKSGIKAVNKVSGQINTAAGSIAGADAARQLADSLKKPIKVTLNVGKGGDDVLDKWLQKALKTKGAKFYGLKAA